MRAIRIFIILASAALAGCVCCGSSTTTNEISISDRETLIGSGRLSFGIKPPVEAPSVPHSGHGIELALSGTSGDAVQNLSAGEPSVVLAGQTFRAPAELRHEYEFGFAEVAYRYRKFFGSGAFGIEALGGIARAQLNVTTASTTQQAHERIGDYGPVGGFGIVWKFRPTTSLQSRFTLFFAHDEDTDMAVERLDLYIAQAIGKHAAVRAGFSSWRVEADRFNSGFLFESDFRARFSGFALGLDLMF